MSETAATVLVNFKAGKVDPTIQRQIQTLSTDTAKSLPAADVTTAVKTRWEKVMTGLGSAEAVAKQYSVQLGTIGTVLAGPAGGIVGAALGSGLGTLNGVLKWWKGDTKGFKGALSGLATLGVGLAETAKDSGFDTGKKLEGFGAKDLRGIGEAIGLVAKDDKEEGEEKEGAKEKSSKMPPAGPPLGLMSKGNEAALETSKTNPEKMPAAGRALGEKRQEREERNESSKSLRDARDKNREYARELEPVIHGKKRYRTELEGATRGINTLGLAVVGAAYGMQKFVAAASPDAASTLSKSFELVSGQIGIMFLPAVVKVSGWLQGFADRISKLDPGTKDLIANGAILTAGLGAFAFVTTKAIGAVTAFEASLIKASLIGPKGFSGGGLGGGIGFLASLGGAVAVAAIVREISQMGGVGGYSPQGNSANKPLQDKLRSGLEEIDNSRNPIFNIEIGQNRRYTEMRRILMESGMNAAQAEERLSPHSTNRLIGGPMIATSIHDPNGVMTPEARAGLAEQLANGSSRATMLSSTFRSQSYSDSSQIYDQIFKNSLRGELDKSVEQLLAEGNDLLAGRKEGVLKEIKDRLPRPENNREPGS